MTVNPDIDSPEEVAESSSYRRLRAHFEAWVELDAHEIEGRLSELAAEDPELAAELRELFDLRPRAERVFDATCAPGSVVAVDPAEPTVDWVGHTLGGVRIERFLGRGGMGVVYEGEQGVPRRRVAVKLIELAGVSAERAQRFAFEVEALARLDHPCVARLHAAGIEPRVGERGETAWFAMELVPNARTLGEWRVQEQPSRRRRLELFLRICEAVEHGHQRGVLHCDLKPSNLLVDGAGVPRVIDFGIAQALDAGRGAGAQPQVEAGQIVGTLAYMSPEQALGPRSSVDLRTDVHALGVVLHELLSSRLPRELEGMSLWRALQVLDEEEAPSAAQRDPSLAGDLDAILARALARDPRRRYGSVGALAEDLRRHLHGEVPAARTPTRGERVRRLLWRHRGALAAVVLLLCVTVGVLLVGLWSAARSRSATSIAEAEAGIADVQRRRVERGAREILGLSAQANLEGLLWRAEQAWPADPARLEQLDVWIGEARALAQRLPELERQYSELLARALPPDAEAERRARSRIQLVAGIRGIEESIGSSRDLVRSLRENGNIGRAEKTEEGLRGMEEALLRFRSFLPERFDASFEDRAEEPGRVASWRFSLLANAILELRRFTRGPHVWEGSLGVWSHHLPQMEARAAWIRRAEEESLRSEDARAAWEEVRRTLGAAEGPYAQGGPTAVRPTFPLLPLGADPRTGLLEFADLLTGDAPRERKDGAWVLREGTAVIYVLLPGGEARTGTEDDPEVQRNEGPVQTSRLLPFLLAKHEFTQGQYLRLVNENPSYHLDSAPMAGGPLYPVERVDRRGAAMVLQRIGARLPTETQYEYALRAGSDAFYPCGEQRELKQHANLFDRSALLAHGKSIPATEWDDGWPYTAPVGSFAPNAFGLYDLAGNVREWCLDRYGPYAAAEARPGDAYRHQPGEGPFVTRGGSYATVAVLARSAARSPLPEGMRLPDLGFRGVRYLEVESR